MTLSWTYSADRVDADRLRTSGRKARLMELDPRYADVIVRRWQEYTGEQAVLEGDGRSFDEIAGERRKRPREGARATGAEALGCVAPRLAHVRSGGSGSSWAEDCTGAWAWAKIWPEAEKPATAVPGGPGRKEAFDATG